MPTLYELPRDSTSGAYFTRYRKQDDATIIPSCLSSVTNYYLTSQHKNTPKKIIHIHERDA